MLDRRLAAGCGEEKQIEGCEKGSFHNRKYKKK
jgi:hypothetical protein